MKTIGLLTLLAALFSSLASASYDQKPLAVIKGGTGVATQTGNRVVITNTTGQLVSNFPTTDTELLYLHNVSSSIQTQLNGKASLALNNLSAVAINSALLPVSSGTINLGSNSLAFNDSYVVKIKDTAAVVSVDPINRHLINGAGNKVLDFFGPAVDVTDLGLTGSSSGKLTLKTAAVTTNHNVTLPATVCTSGQYWADNGSGVMSCTTLAVPALTVVNGGDTDYSILAADAVVRTGTTLTQARTYSLPDCAANIGERHVVKNTPAQTFNVTVDGDGADTIDGAANYALLPGDSVTVICAVSGNWDIE